MFKNTEYVHPCKPTCPPSAARCCCGDLHVFSSEGKQLRLRRCSAHTSQHGQCVTHAVKSKYTD